jgi:hypothetical protein
VSFLAGIVGRIGQSYALLDPLSELIFAAFADH